MLKRADPFGDVMARRSAWGRGVIALGLAYLLCFLAILSAAHGVAHSSSDPFHAAFCSDHADGSSSPDHSDGHDHDLSCCLAGGSAVAVLPQEEHGAVARFDYVLEQIAFASIDNRDAYPVSAPRNSRAPPSKV